MEIQGSEKNRYLVLLYEAVGSAFLILSINFGQANQMVPLTHSLVLFAMTVFVTPVSGGHLNPAVTIGVLIYEGPGERFYNLVFAILIFFAQLYGSAVGALLVLQGTRLSESGTDPMMYRMCHPETIGCRPGEYTL